MLVYRYIDFSKFMYLYNIAEQNTYWWIICITHFRPKHLGQKHSSVKHSNQNLWSSGYIILTQLSWYDNLQGKYSHGNVGMNFT